MNRPKRKSPLPRVVPARPRPPTAPTAGESPYANREQSWLAFNRRVLDQARHPANPLLERAKFLAIVTSNLDEFFEIRAAGIMQQADTGTPVLSIDGLTPREQLRRIYREVNALVADQYACWHGELAPQLAEQGIVFRTAPQLDQAEQAWQIGRAHV